MRFRDRADAGQRLADQLAKELPWLEQAQPVVLALPRGGVPVGFEVARRLHAPLDVIVVRKIGAPGQEELGIGAITSDGTQVLDAEAIAALGIRPKYLEETVARELLELRRRERLYREGRLVINVEGRTAVLVDDGLATGVSARAALIALRKEQPSRLVLAVPVCAAETRTAVAKEADQVVSVITPDRFYAVGVWYDDFSQTTDEEVVALLREAPRAPA